MIAADLAEHDAIEEITTAVLQAFGGLDVLVNNAAVERNLPASKVTGESIDETLFVNLRQAFMLCSAFAKPLFASKGAIVSITSTAATGAGGTQGPCAASKGGLNTFGDDTGHFVDAVDHREARLDDYVAASGRVSWSR